MSQWAAVEMECKYASTPDSRDSAEDWPMNGMVDSLGKSILAKQFLETNRSINQLFQDYKHSLIGNQS